VKYVRADYAPAGYSLFREKGDVKTYRNKNVFPLGYVTKDLISGKKLNTYRFPYRQELLLHGSADFRTEIKPVQLVFPESKSKGFTLTSEGDTYRIKSSVETKRAIRLAQPVPEDEVLFLEMKVKNLTPLQDVSMKIQNEQNRLSANNHIYYNRNTVFHYAVSVKKGDTRLSVIFSSGEFELSSVRSYTLSASDIAAVGRKAGPFEVASIGTRGDVITGSVDAPEDGWFITTVPYDENFRIVVDGNEIPFEKVNTAFVGFPIAKGQHHIVFQYRAPGFTAGAAASIAGFLIFGLILISDRKKRIGKLQKE
jgi:uncharacterized membrane protein YfhO